MEKSRELGMRTFDWSLFELYNDGHISYEEAIRNADSANELRLNIKLKSKRGEPASASAGAELSLHEHKSAEELEAERQKELAAQEEHKRQFEAAQLAKQQEAKQQQAEVEKPKAPPIQLDKLQLSLE
jgi:twitching motility protein PilU